ncbi:MAG: redoxin family protein [Planctomycetota bacterium]
MISRSAWAGLVGAVLLAASCTAPADRSESVAPQATAAQVVIGSKISDLRFVDIRYLPRSLADLGSYDAYVFVFTNTTCPIARRYMPRLNQLHEQYQERVRFVAVNVGAGDSIRDMASHALEFTAQYPFVKDKTGACVAALGISRTPEVAVLDSSYRLVYRGRIDDQYRFGGALPAPRRSDLEVAIGEVLAGETVSVAETPVDGCKISFPATPPAAYTYHEDVAPLIADHCVRCHGPGTAAPFRLSTYRQVRNEGEMIAEVVGDGRMPPWYASPDHGTFQNDHSLTAEQRQVIVDWVRGGMVEGPPPATAAPLHASATKEDASKWMIDEPDLVVSMISAHRLKADGFIPYRYVVLPHVFLRDTWIEAFEILPDNPAVVHHANLAYGSTSQKPGQRTFITGYVPGGQAMDLSHFDNGVAFRIPARSVLGLQIHYVTTGKPEQCNISVGIRYYKGGTVRKRLRFNLADPHRFRIPPHHPAYRVSDSFTLKKDVSLLGLFAHMHLRGKDMTFLAHLPDGTTETLLEIPNYSFDWQLGYEITPGAKRLPQGTRIEARAHYDNSSFNPYNPDPTKAVGYGPQTVDEMMNGYVFFTHDGEDLNLRVNPRNGVARR